MNLIKELKEATKDAARFFYEGARNLIMDPYYEAKRQEVRETQRKTLARMVEGYWAK